MVIPLWGKIVALSLAKKVTILVVAKLYGFPRLYRRSQKLVRYLARDSDQKQWWSGYVRNTFRLPEHVVKRWHGQPSAAVIESLPAHNAAKDSRGKLYSFASSPLVAASRQQVQIKLRAGRLRWHSMKERGSLVKQASVQHLQSVSGRIQSLAAHTPADVATMQFLRKARQAYNFVPAIAASDSRARRLSKPSTLASANAESDVQEKSDNNWDSPFEALKAAVTEGNATLAYRDADDEEEETWEDLLEMEENVWDPHAAQADVLDEFLELPAEGVREAPASQEVPSVTMTMLREWMDRDAEAVCILDVSPSTSNNR
ncbi:hypothetical protein WJX75_009100 [Coccomyxa subellipsoidea]|uniref:Uncharacterized protein n=1 Tax=Coccomyxa subellipsoidea TaxID=248742 RepID=A0ABR2YEJ4_9CHLO